MALKSKALQSRGEKKSAPEGLLVRAQPDKKSSKKKKGKPKPEDQERPFAYKCYNCHKEGHMKKDCPELKKDPGASTSKTGKTAVAENDGYDSFEALMVTTDRPSPSGFLTVGVLST